MQLIERVAEHYDTQEMEFGRTYTWCPETVVLDTYCTKEKQSLMASERVLNEEPAPMGAGCLFSPSCREGVFSETQRV